MKISQFIFNLIAKVREMPRDPYQPDAKEWHLPRATDDPDGSTICFACLAGLYAGAVQWVNPTQTLFAKFTDQYSDEAGFMPAPKNHELDREQIDQLIAINCIREGFWATAQQQLGIPPEDRLDHLQDNYQTIGLDGPRFSEFKSWEELENHLESLEENANTLKTAGY